MSVIEPVTLVSVQVVCLNRAMGHYWPDFIEWYVPSVNRSPS